MKPNVKRSIDRVQFVRKCETDADLSDLGEYTNDFAEWSIIRQGEYSGEYVNDLPCETCGRINWEHGATEAIVLTPCFLDCTDHGESSWNRDEDCTYETCDEFTCPDLPSRGREYRAFLPYAGGEKPGSAEYRTYGLQDFARMEDYGNGWQYVYCYARADIALGGQHQTILSSGIGGVESDAGSYFDDLKREELADLRQQLRAIRFNNLATRRAIGHTTERDG